MSETQLEKVRLEKKFLEEELKLLQDSIPISEAANNLMTYVRNQQDPLQQQTDNEWVAQNTPGGCCTIS